MPFIFALIFTYLTLSSWQGTLPLPQLPSLSTLLPTPTLPAKHISIPKSPVDSGPWGVVQKIGEHTYQIKVQNDARMGTPEEILTALNELRKRHSAQSLKTDPRLCQYSQDRAKYFVSIKGTDAHKGFIDFLENQNGFELLGYGQLGENSSYGYILSGVHLIEWVYMQSPEHNANQLDPKWDRGCVGVASPATNLIFATSPL